MSIIIVGYRFFFSMKQLKISTAHTISINKNDIKNAYDITNYLSIINTRTLTLLFLKIIRHLDA